MVDHEEILLPYGYAVKLAKEFSVSECCMSRYLKGYFRDKCKRIDLIQRIREKARQFKGAIVFITRDIDGTLKCWDVRPRKIPSLGIWKDIINESNTGLPVEEWFKPDYLEIDFSDTEPKKLVINYTP